MADRPVAYEQGRARIAELLHERGASVGEIPVPACPAWRVRDLIAHLQHVAEEYSAGRHPYRALGPDQVAAVADPDRNERNEAWADAGVAARRDRSLSQLLEDWAAVVPRLYRMMTDEPVLDDPHDNDMLGWSAFGDFAIHYQDVHGALGLAPDRDAYSAKLVFATLPILFVAHARTVPGLPGLRFVTARGDVVLGEGDPVSHEVDWFELYRAMAGRRTRDQVAALLAPLDAEQYLPAFSLYPFASEPLSV